MSLELATFDWVKQRWGGFGYLVLGRNENFQLNFCNDQLILHAEDEAADSPVWEILLFDKPTKSQVKEAERMFGVSIPEPKNTLYQVLLARSKKEKHEQPRVSRNNQPA